MGFLEDLWVTKNLACFQSHENAEVRFVKKMVSLFIYMYSINKILFLKLKNAVHTVNKPFLRIQTSKSRKFNTRINLRIG